MEPHVLLRDFCCSFLFLLDNFGSDTNNFGSLHGAFQKKKTNKKDDHDIRCHSPLCCCSASLRATATSPETEMDNWRRHDGKIRGKKSIGLSCKLWAQLRGLLALAHASWRPIKHGPVRGLAPSYTRQQPKTTRGFRFDSNDC